MLAPDHRAVLPHPWMMTHRGDGAISFEPSRRLSHPNESPTSVGLSAWRDRAGSLGGETTWVVGQCGERVSRRNRACEAAWDRVASPWRRRRAGAGRPWTRADGADRAGRQET